MCNNILWQLYLQQQHIIYINYNETNPKVNESVMHSTREDKRTEAKKTERLSVKYKANKCLKRAEIKENIQKKMFFLEIVVAI